MTTLFRVLAALATTASILASVSCSQTEEFLDKEGGGTSDISMSNMDAEKRLNDINIRLDNLNTERDKLDEVRDIAIAEQESYWEFSGSIYFNSENECEGFLQDLSEGTLSYKWEGDKSYPVKPNKPLDCETYLSLGVESANATRKLRALGERERELRTEVQKLEAEVRIQEEAKRAAESGRKRLASKDKERVLALKEAGWDGNTRIEAWDWIEWAGCELERSALGFVSIVTIRGPEGRIEDIWIWGRDVC